MTLLNLLTWFVAVFHHHGAHHVSFGAVSHHLGWILNKHWIIRICYRGSAGCHF